MNAFTPAEMAACSHLIELALQEDLGPSAAATADITSAWFLDAHAMGNTALVARKSGVLAGIQAAALVFARIDSRLRVETRIQDGTVLNMGDAIASISGPMPSILAAERTALNFVQHLSGIASLTRQYVNAVAGLPVKILDTRKTLPGWRLLAKYAVRQGGGHNHRMGLHDMALIKDNHWAARSAHSSLTERIATFRSSNDSMNQSRLVEVEIDTLDQLDETMAAKPDIILLDNMPLATMREAVRCRNATAPAILLEASGGVNLDTVRGIAETGVDRISVGALTHSAPALDIALDYGS